MHTKPEPIVKPQVQFIYGPSKNAGFCGTCSFFVLVLSFKLRYMVSIASMYSSSVKVKLFIAMFAAIKDKCRKRAVYASKAGQDGANISKKFTKNVTS